MKKNVQLFLLVASVFAIGLTYQNCGQPPMVFKQMANKDSTSITFENAAIQSLQKDCKTNPVSLFSVGYSCEGAGFIGFICEQYIGDGGENANDDNLEVYCQDQITRMCLTGEKCPWRNPPWDPQSSYRKGLQATTAAAEDDMTCSPFGLQNVAEDQNYLLVTCASSLCSFRQLSCSLDGKLHIIK